VLDVRPAPRAAAHAAPGRPEHEGQDETDRADDHENDADRVDVDTGDGRVDRPGENCACCDENEADSYAHVRPPWMRFPTCSSDAVSAGGERATVRIGYGSSVGRFH